MRRNLTWFIFAIVVSAALMAVAVPAMLRSINSQGAVTGELEPGGLQPGASISEASAVEPRPDCPHQGIGGVELPCLGGRTVQGEQRATVINVWAWWCGPCREELPLFDQLAAEQPQLHVVGVHADTHAANGAAMLNDLGISLPSYQDDRNLFAAHHALPSVVPITVVLDEQGTVRATYTETFRTFDDLNNAVHEALT